MILYSDAEIVFISFADMQSFIAFFPTNYYCSHHLHFVLLCIPKAVSSKPEQAICQHFFASPKVICKHQKLMQSNCLSCSCLFTYMILRKGGGEKQGSICTIRTVLELFCVRGGDTELVVV